MRIFIPTSPSRSKVKILARGSEEVSLPASVNELLEAYRTEGKAAMYTRLEKSDLVVKSEGFHSVAEIRHQFELLAQLSNLIPQNVPRVFALLEIDGVTAYVMEKVRGKDTHWYRANCYNQRAYLLAQRERNLVANACLWPFMLDKDQLMSQLDNAVRIMHSQDLTHGDIHEKNVILKDADGSPVLIDPRIRAYTLEMRKDIDIRGVNRVRGCLEQIWESDPPF